MAAPVRLYPATRTVVKVSGTPVISMYGPLEAGGRIENPVEAASQGIAVAEDLFVSIAGSASLTPDGTTFAIAPGQSFTIPPGTTTNVSVNAATSGHRFSAYGSSIAVPYAAPTGLFPPSGPTTLTKIIPSYLYQEYNDDEDLQAFVDSYNALAQEYATWFAEISLPVYAQNAQIFGDLLDWIGAGLYGYPRPSLPSGSNRNIGPLNTFAPNVLIPNQLLVIGNQNVYVTTDDVYKRCLTWHLWKGDGKVFTVKWLKRRIMRFLTGENGGPGLTADTSIVSVGFSGDNDVTIRIAPGFVTVTGGAVPNMAYPNGAAPNVVRTVYTPGQYVPFAVILKSGIDAGVLELPFQFNYTVEIG